MLELKFNYILEFTTSTTEQQKFSSLQTRSTRKTSTPASAKIHIEQTIEKTLPLLKIERLNEWLLQAEQIKNIGQKFKPDPNNHRQNG